MIHYTYVEWSDIPHSRVVRPALEDMTPWKDAHDEKSELMMRMALHKSLRERGGLRPGEATTCRVFYFNDKFEEKSGQPACMLLNEYRVGTES